MKNFEELMDAYCAFIEYGVRGWLLFAASAFIAFAITLFNASYDFVAATIMGMGFVAIVWFWSRDYALGYVPKFWLRMGRRKLKKN